MPRDDLLRLPFRENRSELGELRAMAMKQLHYLERKFRNNQKFFDLYSTFMQEYVNLNHMSKISEDIMSNTSIYLPHHGVLRESSITTRLRVVFDGFAKTMSGVSLNDTLMIGANLQDNNRLKENVSTNFSSWKRPQFSESFTAIFGKRANTRI